MQAPALPPRDVPLIDPETGRMTLQWRQYFEATQKLFAFILSELNP